MGYRANVVFKQDGGYVALYMHNGGYQLENNTAKALLRVVDAGRTQDIGYGVRIAISEMIGKDWAGDFEYGLYVGQTVEQTISDNEHDIIVVDFLGDQVTICEHRYKQPIEVKKTYSILEFIKEFN